MIGCRAQLGDTSAQVLRLMQGGQTPPFPTSAACLQLTDSQRQEAGQGRRPLLARVWESSGAGDAGRLAAAAEHGLNARVPHKVGVAEA